MECSRDKGDSISANRSKQDTGHLQCLAESRIGGQNAGTAVSQGGVRVYRAE